MKAEDKNIQEHSRESVDNSVLREPLAPSRGMSKRSTARRGKSKMPAGQKGVAFLRLLTILLILLAIAARRDMQVVGYSLEQKEVVADTMTVAADTMVIHTALIADDVFGYAGTTPLDIYILNDTVVKVVPLENTETPEFFAEAVGIVHSWNGKKVSDAYTMPVDAVSGATLSSNAIIENARRGFAYASKHSGQGTRIDLSVKFVVTLLVLLAGMILPIFFRAKKMRTAILVLDVVVLGLWSGTFISYSMLVGIASNGLPPDIRCIPGSYPTPHRCLYLSAIWKEGSLLHTYLSVWSGSGTCKPHSLQECEIGCKDNQNADRDAQNLLVDSHSSDASGSML